MTICLSGGRAFQAEEVSDSEAPVGDAIGVFEGGMLQKQVRDIERGQCF